MQFVCNLLGSFMVELMVTSSKWAYATCWVTQTCCSQSPCPYSRPLLTCASKGDTQTLKGKSGSVSVGSLGPGVHTLLLIPSEHLWIPQKELALKTSGDRWWRELHNNVMYLVPLNHTSQYGFILCDFSHNFKKKHLKRSGLNNNFATY